MIKVIENCEVRRLNLDLLTPQSSRKSGQGRQKKKKEELDNRNLKDFTVNVYKR